VLGVARDASDEDIRRAYLRLARRTHPDVRGDSLEAAEQMRRINSAWALLSNPDSRAALAHHGRQRPAPQRRAGAEPVGEVPSQEKVPSQEAAEARWPSGEGSDSEDFDGDDRPITDGRLPEWMRLGAPAMFVVGVCCLIFGAMTGLLAVFVLGAAALAFAALMFLLAPFVVLVTSRGARR